MPAMIDKKSGRYKTPQDESYQLGSNDTVLANKLGIISVERMEDKESVLLQQTTAKMMNIYSADHQFSAKDVCDLHKLWLGDVYVWAGEYRSVNMSKGGFTFAVAHLIQKLMQDFERNCLKKYTPTSVESEEQVATALAIVHVEFILVHPFREGNGRLGRMLATLMALQAGLPVLNFDSVFKESPLEHYFSAVQQGLDRNYEPMVKIFEQVIKCSY